VTDEPTDAPNRWRVAVVAATLGRLIDAVRQADPAAIEQAAARLGQARWYLAPIGWATATIVLLLDGMKLLVRNWRLIPVEALPAVWISLTLYTLERHIFDGREATIVRGPVAWLIGVLLTLVTLACYWCNAVFAFTLLHPHEPRIRPAWIEARRHKRFVNAWGLSVGIGYAVVAIWVSRVGPRVYALALGALLTVMIITFVAVPASLLGTKRKQPPKEYLAGAATRGVLSAIAVAPGFVLNRIGLLLLSFRVLRIPGVALFVLGAGLQAVATSSARAVKMGALLAVPGTATAGGPLGAEASGRGTPVEGDGQAASSDEGEP